MLRILTVGAALVCCSSVYGQTLMPVPTDAEARAPRPARAPGITTALAVEASQVAIQACAVDGLKITALVADADGVPIAMISGDGAAAITQRIASGKARTAIKLNISSGEAQARAKQDPALLQSLSADPAVGPPRPGAFPIVVGGSLKGAIAVSGAPTGAQDEPCAKAGLAIISGRLAAQTGATPPLPNPANITFVLPGDLKWEGDPGEQRVKLYGDPDQPGPYGILYKWGPGHNSKPHTHATDRFAYVVSGTWWMSTASTEDKTTLYPMHAGSFVIHKANKVHWDGAIDETAVILITGTGPIKTTRLP